MKLVTYDDLRHLFVGFMPETGAPVSSMDCTAFEVVRDAGLVPKPLLAAKAPEKRKNPTRPETNVQKVVKLKFAAGRLSEGWFVLGV